MKVIADTVYDASLDRASLAKTIHFFNGQPTSWADALSRSVGFAICNTTDFTKGDGDTSGRKLTYGGTTNISITRTSTIDHVGIIDSTDFLAATTHAVTAVTSGDVRNLSAFDLMEIRDPS